jgi:5-methyltetrahydropteroyltriglutamate--homocysteine methyltransferase
MSEAFQQRPSLFRPGKRFFSFYEEDVELSVETTVIGSYPKPPDEGRPFVLRKTLHSIERGEATAEDLDRAQDDLVREVIAEQETAGIDLVTDGQVRWDDLLTPFARHIAGFEIGGLLRWFDNNTYYRRPVCVGPPEWRGPSSVDAFKFAVETATAPVKAVIPGPITFTRMSLDEHFGTHEDFVLAIARVLAQEAFELEAAGASVIQIDEPSLLEAPEDLDLAAAALGVVVGDLQRAETVLATYFGDAKRLGPQIFDLPVDGFGFDLVSGPENREVIKEIPPEKKLQAGIVDARNTKLEDTDALARTISDLAELVTPQRLRVAPSCGLDYLPREKARAKLQRLSDAAKKVGA